MNLFNNRTDVSKYNLITENNRVIPNYNVENEEVYLELYFSPQKTLCILGKVDNNYTVWCSITSLEDTITNKDIFNYIAKNRLSNYSSASKAVGNKRYDEIRKWYKCSMKKSRRQGISWETPFGNQYGQAHTEEEHGEYFARDVKHHYKELLEKCDFRIDGGTYLDVLTNYLRILNEETDYHQIKPLIQLLEAEAYLRVSPNETAKELYVACMGRGKYLYDRYMDTAKG